MSACEQRWLEHLICYGLEGKSFAANAMLMMFAKRLVF